MCIKNNSYKIWINAGAVFSTLFIILLNCKTSKDSFLLTSNNTKVNITLTFCMFLEMRVAFPFCFNSVEVSGKGLKGYRFYFNCLLFFLSLRIKYIKFPETIGTE